MMDLSMYSLLTEMNSTNIIRLYEPYRIMPAIGEAVIVHNYWSNQWLRGILTSFIDDEQDEFSVSTRNYLHLRTRRIYRTSNKMTNVEHK